MKAVEVRYEIKHIYVNGKSMDALSAMKTLKSSRKLSPVPDIVVSVRREHYKSAIHFLKSIEDASLCDEARCWIKIERSYDRRLKPQQPGRPSQEQLSALSP